VLRYEPRYPGWEDAGVIAGVTLDEMIDEAREELRRRMRIYAS
jgi:hypothetical protein